jgi:hypothetical protein
MDGAGTAKFVDSGTSDVRSAVNTRLIRMQRVAGRPSVLSEGAEIG